MKQSVDGLVQANPDLEEGGKVRDRSHREGKAKTTQDGEPNPFSLEDNYPQAADVFLPFLIGDVRSSDSIVVLDTSTLLLPYNIKQDDLTTLQAVYKELALKRRLMLPARVAREFIKNRDSKLADLLQALNDQKSRLQVPNKRLSPLLEGVQGHGDLVSAQEQLSEARKNYDKHLTAVIDRLRAWRGDDPVTALYREVFSDENIIESSESRSDLLNEWLTRSINKTPPGYKDANKDDSGIGDFLIWKAILLLGEREKRDCVFVTGEEKADWFVRSNKDAVYARPELIDEYRRASGGKAIELISLADLLNAMNVESAIVEEVRSAEAAASAASAREAWQLDASSNQPLKLMGLRRIAREIFPGRERSGYSHWKAFRGELKLAGYNTLEEVANDLEKGKESFLNDERSEHPEMFYTDVGASRGAIVASRPDLIKIIGSITPSEFPDGD